MNINKIKPCTTEDLNRLNSAMKRIIENSTYGMMWHSKNKNVQLTKNNHKQEIKMPQKTVSVYDVEHALNISCVYKPTSICYVLDYEVDNLFYPQLKQLISGRFHCMNALTIYPRKMYELMKY